MLLWLTLSAAAQEAETTGASAAPAAATEDAGPTGAQTPCDWLLARREAGLPMTELIRLADTHHDLFNGRDVKCLKKAGVHSRVVEAAAGDLSRERDDREQEEHERAEREAERAEREAERAEAVARRAAEREEALRDRYDIAIIAVVLGPAMQGGAHWDGPGTVDPEVSEGALALLAGSTGLVSAGAAALTTYMTNEVIAGFSAPDVYGYAELVGPHAPAEWSSLRLSLAPPQVPISDTYYATFSGSPGYRGIKVGEGDAVRITLYDADDLTDHDRVGVVEITATHIREAAKAEGIVAIEAASTTMDQVLVVQVSVRAASSIRPEIAGVTFMR